MARMVATKAALSIRVDALTEADEKSEPTAPSIGIENRAKLEARLRALEQGGDAAGVRAARTGTKQQKFQMKGETSTYNTAADAVDLMPTQREPMEAAVQAALDVKAEKKRAKEERRAKKKAAKEEKEQEESEDEENKMDVDGEDGGKKRKGKHEGETEEERKARKKAKKEAKAAAANGDAESSKKKRRKSEA